MPMAGLAIGIVQTTQQLYPEFYHSLSALTFAAIAALETLGPLATDIGLRLAGETKTGIRPYKKGG